MKFRKSLLNHRGGYLLTEALVYISVVLVVLGVGYVALYRSINNSLALRRSTDDIKRALTLGERWREDTRHAERLRVEETADGRVLHMESQTGTNAWRRTENGVLRKAANGPWITIMANVKGCSMEPDPRKEVVAWRMELELATRSKSARIRPLFTFTAVPGASPLK